ncbi:zinc finger protein 878-like [Mya arenaria]|uniref:zinc finger protein 878-like n=1 Tax=Mya arenaria TaxID=6604 RepID=UPI0022E6D3B0|nr:zinc finger protein 878-like [Mya arenaria]
MDSLFTSTTVLLSQDFLEKHSFKIIQSKLAKLRLVTGVQFSKNNAIHGNWEQINTAFHFLQHWDEFPDHEPSDVSKSKLNGLCKCRDIQNLPSTNKEKVYCTNIYSASVKKDIETLRDDLLQRKNTEQCIENNPSKDTKKWVNIKIPSVKCESTRESERIALKQTPERNSTLRGESHAEIKDLSVTESYVNDNKCTELSSGALADTGSALLDDSYCNFSDGTLTACPNTYYMKACEGDNCDGSSCVKIDSTKRAQKKRDIKKPGDTGYWSRVKRSDNHLEHICSECGVILKSRKRYNEHKRRMHKKDFKCEVCLKGFGYPSDLAKHKCPGKPDVQSQRETRCTNKTNGEKHIKEQKHPCQECSFIASTEAKLEVHVRRKHNIVFECGDCLDSFLDSKSLKSHIDSVHRENMYICEKCSKSYRSKFCFDSHLKSHEKDYVKPNFLCGLCRKSFTTKYILSQHTKSSHLGVKMSYLCPVCGKKFRQRSSFRQHMNVHNGVTPYKCETCGRAFTYHKSLREHVFMHDNIRRFPCDICGKKFRQRTTLYIHKKTHNTVKDHACKDCGKTFAQRQALERHRRIHTGVRPYKCLVCSKQFRDSSTIRRHIISLHQTQETNWRSSVSYAAKKKSDYYITGGPYQNRTYDNTTESSNNTSVELANDNNLSDEPEIFHAIPINSQNSQGLILSDQRKTNGQASLLLQVPLQASSHSFTWRTIQSDESVANMYNALPNSHNALSESTVTTVSNSTDLVQSISLRSDNVPVNFDQMVDIGTIHTVPPVSANIETEKGHVVPTFVQLQPSLQLLNQRQTEDTADTTILQPATFIPFSYFRTIDTNSKTN